MTRIDFYFNAPSKAEIARKLAGKAIQAGNQVLLFTRSEQRAQELDSFFWTASALSFLPHARCQHHLADKTPILIGSEPQKLGKLDILVNLEFELPDWFASFDRVLEIVTAQDEDKDKARGRFRFLKDRGYPVFSHDLNSMT